ncbi:PREDICTED: uncharacterized protein LOC104816761 [Tarenaya hassleriana]|uniref:uncharacterized protein LOC104816761 n=1 Tax=Tarenaya hassleriana TaxID=28532 RepID=UPI00053C23AE|nr:PREDICTED: uncharacterized protein LOC104816761 [Tarenaya hassleriana]
MMFQLREGMVSDKAASGFLGKRSIDRGYTMDPDESSRKRKRRDESDLRDNHQELHLSSDVQLLERFKWHKPTSSFFDPKRRTSEEDSRKNTLNPEYYYNNRMSLDLELNLSPSLVDLNHHHHNHTNDNDNKDYVNDHDHDDDHHHQNKKKATKGSELGASRRSLSWLGLDHENCNRGGGEGGGFSGGEEEEAEEMMARVCMKCHMLVMLCKASPSCPNCKFMHSPQQSSHSNSLFFSPKPPLLSLIDYFG